MNAILRPFSFSGRAGRLEYIITTILACLPLIITVLSTRKIMRISGENFPVYLLIYAIVLIWICMAAAVRRNHDLGQSGIGGFFNTGLLFKRGILGFNRFGNDPSTKYDEEIAKIESTLDCGRYWKCTYNDEVADVELKCVEMAAFDGEKCCQYYYYYQDGTLLFSVNTACDYSIDYDSDQDIYIVSFFNQETVEMKNDNCDPKRFEEFSAEWDYDDSDEETPDDEEDEEDEDDYDMRIFDVSSSSLILISDYEYEGSPKREDIYVYFKDKKIKP